MASEMVVPIFKWSEATLPAEPTRWSPEYKDWGFDDIFPVTPDPFLQVEAWDHERRRDGREPWVEPRHSELDGLRNIFTSELLAAQLDYNWAINRQLFGEPRALTAAEQMAADMTRYATATDPLHALTRRARRLRRFRWRYELARKLYPAMEDNY